MKLENRMKVFVLVVIVLMYYSLFVVTMDFCISIPVKPIAIKLQWFRETIAVEIVTVKMNLKTEFVEEIRELIEICVNWDAMVQDCYIEANVDIRVVVIAIEVT